MVKITMNSSYVLISTTPPARLGTNGRTPSLVSILCCHGAGIIQLLSICKKGITTGYTLTFIKSQDGRRIHHLRYSCECVGGLSDLCDLINSYFMYHDYIL